MKACFFCNETDEIHIWKHPVNDGEYAFCAYCLKSIIGVCAECDGILSKLDPVGVNSDGHRICYKCSAVHDMALDED